MNKVETIHLGQPPVAQPDGRGFVALVALMLLVVGFGLLVTGVNILWGAGWALLTAAPLPIGLAAKLLSGVKRGG